MSNMSYCRFENTVRDLADCAENINEPLGHSSEIQARLRLINKAKEILEAVGFEVSGELDEDLVPTKKNRE